MQRVSLDANDENARDAAEDNDGQETRDSCCNRRLTYLPVPDELRREHHYNNDEEKHADQFQRGFEGIEWALSPAGKCTDDREDGEDEEGKLHRIRIGSKCCRYCVRVFRALTASRSGRA